jgi:transcription termination factor Rho
MGRPDFDKLQAAAPTERLSLQSGSVIARVVDLVMPIGKGQRALIVAPPGAGATTTLRAIGDALPSGCHRMLVLVDQRPEDVAEIRRSSTGGEIIASTVDMTPTSHVELASLALDRARRLVELGHDVVVLLDSVTRLGRAYQATSGRLDRLDAPAVTALRQFLGAARAIENGGSLTIVATVSTGSPIEAAILDELKDTANASLWLRPDSTVDVAASGTRQHLLSPSEQVAAARLRELLPTMDPAAALDQVSSLA